jgi:hypothetical protein
MKKEIVSTGRVALDMELELLLILAAVVNRYEK